MPGWSWISKPRTESVCAQHRENSPPRASSTPSRRRSAQRYEISKVAATAGACKYRIRRMSPTRPGSASSSREARGRAVFAENVTLGASISISASKRGSRNIIPITGGTTSGRVIGKILSGGADYQLTGLDARYTLAPDDGEFIIVRNCGTGGSSPSSRRAWTALRSSSTRTDTSAPRPAYRVRPFPSPLREEVTGHRCVALTGADGGSAGPVHQGQEQDALQRSSPIGTRRSDPGPPDTRPRNRTAPRTSLTTASTSPPATPPKRCPPVPTGP